MKRLNVAIVGAGGMGQRHASVYSKMNEAKVTTVCDVYLNLAQELASRVGADKVCSDFGEALKKEELDIVDVCVPTPFHPDVVIKAAEYGKNIICEKPMALSIEHADRMINATKKSGVKFMVAHVLRFCPDYVVTKRIVDSGKIGSVHSASCSRYADESALHGKGWFLDPEVSGGAIIDLHIHDLDYLNWLFGKPRKVFCAGLKSKKGAWDDVFTTVSYSHGKGFAAAAWGELLPHFPSLGEFRVVCEEGVLEFNCNAARTLTMFSKNGVEYPELPKKDGYCAEIEYFVNCVLNDIEPTVTTPQDARLALETAVAARKSAEEGKNVLIG
jgi:predicted dehydrogenase